ncbi:hypothetical protein ACEYW6_04950, partial [Nostoc sp. UIC 10607]|uniref:hypothetical protein n=1 Tax=Nostoc sp. UIC 10607 TaxID=3045935 RepID=UPI0039A2AA83
LRKFCKAVRLGQNFNNLLNFCANCQLLVKKNGSRQPVANHFSILVIKLIAGYLLEVSQRLVWLKPHNPSHNVIN